MGCSLGPSNTLIVNRAKFFFDASAPWAQTSATDFLNPFYIPGSYSNYTLDSDTNFVSIAGTGVSKYLDLKQLQPIRSNGNAYNPNGYLPLTPMKIDFQKSYVNVASGQNLGATVPFSFCFGIYYYYQNQIVKK